MSPTIHVRSGLACLILVLFLAPIRVVFAAGFFLPPDTDNLSGGRVMVDSTGRIHAVYSSASAAGRIYYASCVVNCDSVVGWTAIALADPDISDAAVRLQLTPAGGPRVLWFDSFTGPYGFRYAACDANCTTLSNWGLANLTGAFGDEQGEGSYFALDAQQRPRFVYHDVTGQHIGLFYAFCDSGCTTAANWYEGQLAELSSSVVDTEYIALLFDSQNVAKLLYRFDPSNGDPSFLVYAQCASDCFDPANWSSTALIFFSPRDDFAFRLDSSGRPRAMVFQNSQLRYLWCDAGCMNPANWFANQTGLPSGHGEDVDLILDGSNRPIVAYHAPTVLGYARCSADCESATPIWSNQILETSTAVDAEAPVPLKSDCTLSFWSIGFRPTLSMDSAGNINVIYDADHLQANPNFGSSCSAHRDLRRLRFIRVAGSGGTRARGDVNGDGSLTTADVIYLTRFLFAAGPAPIGSGDVNADMVISVADIFYLINHLFAAGPAPPI